MDRERRVHMIGLSSMWIGITSGRYAFITEQINIREKTMRAAVIREYGLNDVVEIVEVERPEPGEGEPWSGSMRLV